MPRACVCLRGVHYLQISNYKTDFRNSSDKIKECVIDALLDKGYDVDVICLTYESEILDELKNVYKPVHVSTLPSSERVNGSNWHRQCIFHLMSVRAIRECEAQTNAQYDLIVNIRYDLLLNTKITDMNVDFTRMNITYRHASGNCDDNIFIFPRSELDSFEQAFHKLFSEHRITHEFNHAYSDSKINYIVDVVDHEKYWKLNRIAS